VIVTSADVTGRPVGKRVSVEVFRRVVHEGIPLSSCVLGWDVDQWPGPVQEYTGHHTGWHDVRLVPDLGTLRPAAWLERTAICLADFAEMGSDELAPVAPRTILRRQVGSLGATGLTAQVASELEFALYHGTYDEGRANGYETLVPTTLARADYTIQAGDRYEGFFSGVRDALAASELGPWTSQVEWGLGQWEINLEYRHALEMADRHLLFKLAMRTLAANAGMAVTFMARPFGNAPARDRRRPGSRAGAHAVLRTDRELVPADDERRVLGQRAVVGIRQPDGLVPRAHRVARVHPARVARARRRCRSVPRDRGAARLGARRDRNRGRTRRAADGE
jgi:glutamine synthetase